MSDRQETWRSTSSGAFVEEILHKYNCHTATDGNFFARMSSQTLAERIAALKGHVFSNTNTEYADYEQTNNVEGREIDLSNNTPPLRQSVLTNADAKHNQSAHRVDSNKSTKSSDKSEHAKCRNYISDEKEDEDILDRPGAVVSKSNLALSGENLDLRGEHDCGLTATQFPSCSGYNVSNSEGVICLDYSKQSSTTPVVVITPAVMESYAEEEDNNVDVNSNGGVNGELCATMSAKDTDTCSLSSLGSCSENEILTDDEPSDDEMRQPVEDKTDKVRLWVKFWSIDRTE